MNEAEFLAELRRLPLHPGARALSDDVAVVDGMVLTKDMLVEGVHFLPTDPPADIAWKLVATNLSDLAAKGARPVGMLLGYPLGDAAWDRAFLQGLREASVALGCPVLGGDTVTLPPGTPRFLSLTAVGGGTAAPPRSCAQPTDSLWVTGTIGDAGAGLAIARGRAGPDSLLRRYRRPTPRLAEGHAVAPAAHAMMDISDGLLIDAARMATASGIGVVIELDLVPLSSDLIAFGGDTRAARLAAATAGDDYELLFAFVHGAAPPVAATCVGHFTAGHGLTLTDHGAHIDAPDRLGFQHG